VNEVPIPGFDGAPTAADVVRSPVGVVHVPPMSTSAVVQYWNFIDWIEVVDGSVKVNKCFTTPLGIEPPSVAPSSRVRLRGVMLVA